MSLVMLGLAGALVLIVVVLLASRRPQRRGTAADGSVPLALYSDKSPCDSGSGDGGACDGGGGD